VPGRRIEIHHHIDPPAYAAWLASQGVRPAGGRELPAWSDDDALAVMDTHDVATTVGSGSTPGVHLHLGLLGSPTALPSPVAFARPGHVLFGADWPYAPLSWFTTLLDAYAALDADGHAAVDRRNAEVLFPGLANEEIA